MRPSDTPNEETSVEPAPTPTTDPAADLLAVPEGREWSEQLKAALREVLERHPKQREAILRSLQTPQLGEYHNEGPRMDAHIDRMLATLDDIASGAFPATIDAQSRALIREAATEEDPANPAKRRVKEDLVDYTFLHDIAKPDSMTLKIEGGDKGIEITWEQWLVIESRGEPWRVIIDGEERPITSISYYHQSERDAGQHGAKGAMQLAEDASIAAPIRQAIASHEVAYQFAKVGVIPYETHIAVCSPEEQALIIAGSYVDTMGSVCTNGRTDLGNFLNLLQSRRNHLVIQDALRGGAIVPENKLGELKKRTAPLSASDVLAVAEKPFDMEKFKTVIVKLVAAGELTVSESVAALDAAKTDPKLIGTALGPKMRILKAHLR